MLRFRQTTVNEVQQGVIELRQKLFALETKIETDHQRTIEDVKSHVEATLKDEVHNSAMFQRIEIGF